MRALWDGEGERGGGGGGGVAQHPLTRAPGYNFPLFLVYQVDMPDNNKRSTKPACNDITRDIWL